MNSNVLRNLGETLIGVRGMPDPLDKYWDAEKRCWLPLASPRSKQTWSVAIWRLGKNGTYTDLTVGEFLSKPENQSGTWFIDGGWGGPPGPIVVDWDDENKCWINQGYNGRFRTT